MDTDAINDKKYNMFTTIRLRHKLMNTIFMCALFIYAHTHIHIHMGTDLTNLT